MNRVCPTTGTYSQEYQYDCLLRWICSIPELWRRQKWLKEYRKRYGKERADDLENDVRAMWESLKVSANREAAKSKAAGK